MVIGTGDITAWYDIEDNTGTTLVDDSGNGNDFTFTDNPTWATDGPTGLTYSLDFDGSGNRIAMGTSLLPDGTWSIAAWVKFDTDGVNSHVIGRNASIIFGTQSGDKTAARIYNGGWGTVSEAGTTDLTWQHLVMTWTTNSPWTITLYVNGSSVGTSSRTSMSNSGNTLFMGAYNPTSDGRYMDGHIGQCILFNKELTSTEVSTLYNSGTAQTYDDFFASGTNLQLNISDTWKTVDAMQINIGDVWKSVAGAQINIGDVWKTIF